MNIRNVIERLKYTLNSSSEDFTKCELMENILRAYQRSIEDRIQEKFRNEFFSYSSHNTATIIKNKLNAVIRTINQTIDVPEHYEIFVCSENSEVYVSDSILYTAEGRPISENAYEDNYFTCTDCEEIFHNDESRTFYEDESDLYCGDCISNNGWYCDYHDDNHHESYHCDENDDEDNSSSNYLDHYNDRIHLYFLGNPTIPLRYGIEVELHTRHEVISRNDIVEKFRDTMNYDDLGNHKEYILCKHDGSLHSDYGFELVSTNCSFDFHKKTFWNKFFNTNPNQYVKAYHGYNCGIHIHFSRSAFTTNQLKRLNCFYNNSKNRSLIVEIAGRDENQYCRFHPTIDFNSPIKTHGCKYSVINFDNKETVEVRIFRSNIKQISFFRYLEFVHTVNLWIRSNQKNNAEDLHHNDYFDWLLKNVHKDYANLLIFLDDKQHFEHLKYIEQWKTVYSDFKDIVHDFRVNNSELINQELEREN
mgnify:FL=1